jgi:SAM-dependent methyltransferase
MFRPDPLDPPPFAGNPGRGDLVEIGREFFELFRMLGNLRPRDRVLEIGCSIGRMAIPLTGYLEPPGRYDGVDISGPSIRWCRRAIGRRFPSFQFHHADVFNGEYNRRGKIAAEDYEFPFPPSSFDFIFLTSVFTHMLPGAVRHYLDEIARLLSPGGRVLATFFLTPTSPPAPGTLRIDHVGDGYRTANPQNPEEAVAYEETAVREWFGSAGLTILEPVRRGCWTGPSEFHSYQDVVVAERVVTSLP